LVKRSPHFSTLSQADLFVEIPRRVESFRKKNPHVHLVNLSIGDTSQPLIPPIHEALVKEAHQLGTREGYKGYGPEQGTQELREAIAQIVYRHQFSSEEIFISDGAKCDIGRLQLLFASCSSVAVQDPVYPAYVDTSLLSGKKIHLLPCLKENGFLPDVEKIPSVDLLFLSSPNNPTDAVFTRDELTYLVRWAHKEGTIIIFDAAYASYITDPTLPHSIYEIEGAKEVAIEVGSFSKSAGFTGVRLGWSVVPKELCYEEGTPLLRDWDRLVSAFYNGSSRISQKGGIAALTKEGLEGLSKQIGYYQENAQILKRALSEKGYAVYGGHHTPFLWVDFNKRNSWDLFSQFLEQAHLILIPGRGFGPSGEGFMRVSGFGHREEIFKGIERLSCISLQSL